MNNLLCFLSRICQSAILRCVTLILVSLPWSCPGYCQSTLEITDAQGTKHIVSECHETSRFYLSGTPFYQGTGYRGAPLLNTLIAIDMHTQSDQDKITNIAIKKGYQKNVYDNSYHVVLLIPQYAINDIKFSDDKSSIRLTGGISFEAGRGYEDLKGIEDLGNLGHREFSSYTKGISEIKSQSPSPFVGSFSFFAAAETPPEVEDVNGGISIVKPLDLSNAIPFEVKITDNAGAEIILEQALFCELQTILTGRRDKEGSYYIEPDYTVRFMSDIQVTFGGRSQRLISASMLSKIRPGRRNYNFWGLDADLTSLSGETVNDTITSRYHGDGGGDIDGQSGIIGYCSKGWVWVPWMAISELDFRNKYQIAKDAAREDDLEKIKALIKNDSYLVFSKDNDGYTLLHWAAISGHKDVAELLLANKAVVNGVDNYGWTPLHYAIQKGYKDVAELLIDNKADVNISPTIEQRVKIADEPYKSKGYSVANIIVIEEGNENAIIGRQNNGDYFKATVQGRNILTHMDLKSPPLQKVKNDLKNKIENPLMWLINRESLKDKDYNTHYQALLNNARQALFGHTKGTAVLTLSNPNIPDNEIIGTDGKLDPVKFALANLSQNDQVIQKSN